MRTGEVTARRRNVQQGAEQRQRQRQTDAHSAGGFQGAPKVTGVGPERALLQILRLLPR